MQTVTKWAAKGVIVTSTSADSSGTAPALAGPFTLREVLVMAGALLLLVGSVLPFQIGLGTYANVWNHQTTAFNQFVSLALPLIIGGAFAWRRLAGKTSVTAGSLTLDQLGSVVSLLGILYFFISSVMSMNPAFLLGLLGALLMAAGTTLAPYIPGFVLDFAAGEAALLTRPVRPSAPRAEAQHPGPNRQAVPSVPASPAQPAATESGAAAAPTAGMGTGAESTPAPASQQQGATPVADATVTTGLAAGHGTTPEPVPGAWPLPGEDEDPAGAESVDPAKTEQDDEPAASTSAASTSAAAGPPTDAADAADAAGAADLPVLAEEDVAGTPAAQAQATEAAAAQTSVADDVPAAGNMPAPDAPAAAAPAPDAPAPHTMAQDMTVHGAPAPETSVHSVAAGSDEAPHEESHQSFTATSGGGHTSASQAFWFAVPDSRTAVNEASGRNSFVLEPGEWILALEDRGYEFLVQHSDGSVGVLRDLSRIERA